MNWWLAPYWAAITPAQRKALPSFNDLSSTHICSFAGIGDNEKMLNVYLHHHLPSPATRGELKAQSLCFQLVQETACIHSESVPENSQLLESLRQGDELDGQKNPPWIFTNLRESFIKLTLSTPCPLTNKELATPALTLTNCYGLGLAISSLSSPL